MAKEHRHQNLGEQFHGAPSPFASGGRLVALAAALFRTEVEKKIYARVARGSNKQFLIYGQT